AIVTFSGSRPGTSTWQRPAAHYRRVTFYRRVSLLFSSDSQEPAYAYWKGPEAGETARCSRVAGAGRGHQGRQRHSPGGPRRTAGEAANGWGRHRRHTLRERRGSAGRGCHPALAPGSLVPRHRGEVRVRRRQRGQRPGGGRPRATGPGRADGTHQLRVDGTG